jgi:hypothetical protein
VKLAFFIGAQKPWYKGLGDELVRLRLRSDVSHCELAFEPGDGVDALLPDATAQADASGALWCASSVPWERMPAFSARRPGSRGGVRFARINLNDASQWQTVELPWAGSDRKYDAARWFKAHEGSLYDWQEIAGFLAWVVAGKADRYACHEACGAALGLTEAGRFDPASLRAAALWRRA